MRTVPGSRLPRVIQFYRYGKDVPGYLTQQREEFGPVFKIRMPFDEPYVIVCDPELIDEVLKLDEEYLPAYPANRWIKPLFGEESILFVNGQGHRTHRKIMKPHLSVEASDQSRERIRQQAERYLNQSGVEPLSAYEWTLGFMLRSTLENLISMTDQDWLNRFESIVLSARKRYSSFYNLALDAAAYSDDYHPLITQWARLNKHHIARDEIAAQFHDLLREHMNQRVNDAYVDHDDVFEKYASRYQSGEITELELMSSVMTLLIAGFDPPSIVATRLLLILSFKPELQGTIRDELSHSDSSASLRQAILETLRLYPPLYAVTRTLKCDIKLGEYEIPANTNLFLCVHLMQREKDYWPDPLKFDPQRFANGTLPGIREGFMPFGGNKRACPGRHYGVVKIEEYLSEILRSNEVVPLCESSAPDTIQCYGPVFTPREQDLIQLKPL
ncbi:MAG: cytochrome P450 [Pseudomonadota bacterium]